MPTKCYRLQCFLSFSCVQFRLAGLFATDGLRSSPSFATFLTQAPYAPDSKQEKSSSDWVSSPFGEPTVALDVAKVDSAAAAKNAQKAANAFR